MQNQVSTVTVGKRILFPILALISVAIIFSNFFFTCYAVQNMANAKALEREVIAMKENLIAVREQSLHAQDARGVRISHLVTTHRDAPRVAFSN